MPQNPLDILRQLGAGGGNPNGPAELRGLQGQFRDEARLKSRMPSNVPKQDMMDFGGIANDWQGQMNESPLAQQEALTGEFNQGNYEAAAGGFGAMGGTDTTSGQTPFQSREIYRRGQEREKMQQPLVMEQTRQAGDLAQQKEMSRGNLAVANTSADVKSELADLMFNNAAAGNRSMSISGVGSVGAGRAFDSAPNAAFENIQQAGLNYENSLKNQGIFSGIGKMIGLQGEIPMRKKALDDAVRGYLGQHPADPGIKNFAFQIYNDPEVENKTSGEIMTMIKSSGDYEKDDLQILTEILNTIRRK